jgi:D-3-phosphoglycerate dehydrogenase
VSSKPADASGGKRPLKVLVALDGPHDEFASLDRLTSAGIEIVDGFGLEETADDEAMVAALDGMWGVIAGGQRFPRAVLAASSRLRVIARFGVGFDRIDIDAATELGIAVTITPNGNASAVADFTMALMLAVLRRIPEEHARVVAGGWRTQTPSADLTGTTVGLVGFGRIGRLVARRLRGFDCPVLVCDPYLDVAVARKFGVRRTQLADLLPAVDVLSLHLPLTESTRHIIDRAALHQLKRGAIVVNTARGPLVDEEALAELLASGRLGGAGLDVFSTEPLPLTSPLRNLPGVVLTGHVAAHSSSALRGMMTDAVDNLLAMAADVVPDGCVNPSALGRRP